MRSCLELAKEKEAFISTTSMPEGRDHVAPILRVHRDEERDLFKREAAQMSRPLMGDIKPSPPRRCDAPWIWRLANMPTAGPTRGDLPRKPSSFKERAADPFSEGRSTDITEADE